MELKKYFIESNNKMPTTWGITENVGTNYQLNLYMLKVETHNHKIFGRN